MSLFIAINFPEDIKEEIYSIVGDFRARFSQVSFVNKNNIHLTLKYLGSLKRVKNEKEQINLISKQIEKSTTGITSFKLKFSNIGYFDNKQLIIWLGVEKNDKLLRLCENIEKNLSSLGFGKSRKKFCPHITLGRGKKLRRQTKNIIIKKLKGKTYFKIDSFSANKVYLMQSTLTRKGPIYKRLTSFPLTKSV